MIGVGGWGSLLRWGNRGNGNNNKNNQNKRRNNTNQKLKKGKYQTDLHGNNLDIEDLESYGDELLKQKEKGIIRIGLQNANNLPEYKQHEKNKQFLKYIYEHDFDLSMLNEIGLNWKRIDSSNSF